MTRERHPNSSPDDSPGARIPVRQVRRAWPLLAVAAWPLLQLAGCAGPGYYAQAISGHLRLMRARVETREAIADPDASPELAASLRQADSILAFARAELGLPRSDSYRQVVITGRDAVTWNVVAAPAFSVEPRQWCFPVAGCVPYRGYFRREAAEDFAARCAERGDDVVVSPATAYSTLGWFDDPLLDTMFLHGSVELAAVLFHELAHEKLYVRGDAAFNEAYASFVESAGVRTWANATGNEVLADNWQLRQQAARDFAELLADTRRALDDLYRTDLDAERMRERKAEAFDAMRETYRTVVRERWRGTDHFAGWMEGELNNAHLALMAQYQGGGCAFQALFREADQDFQRFHELAQARARLPSEDRKAWLETDCDAFDSAPEL